MHVTYVKLQRQTGTRYKAIIRDGDRLLATKTFTRKSDATTWASTTLRDSERLEALGNPKAKLTLKELADLRMQSWDGRDHAYIGRVQALVDIAGKQRLLDITEDYIRDDLDTYAKGHCPATVNRRKAAWSSLFKFAIEKRIVRDNPVHRIPALKENNERVRFLTDDERKALLAACDASAWPLMRLLVILAMTTGARLGELLSLRWEQIDFTNRKAILSLTKNGDPRTIVFPTPAVVELMQHRCTSGLIFARADGHKALEFKKHWQKVLKASGLEVGFHFHDLRHDAASQLIMAEVSLLEVAAILGHRSLQSTKRYAHLSHQHKLDASEKVMNAVFERLPK